MANINCEACDELKRVDPSLIVNGFTEEECASLMNDTGLVAGSGNNDCTDLNNMNDCLIGNMAAEIETKDVCDWREYTQEFVSNAWTVYKGIICAVCGLWNNVHLLWDSISNILGSISNIEELIRALQSRVTNAETNITNLWNSITGLTSELNSTNSRVDGMCALLDQSVLPNLTAYGTLPLAGDTPNRCGTKSNKVIQRPDDGSLNPYTKHSQNFGLNYGKMVTQSCSGSGNEMIEWIVPHTYLYDLRNDLESGDVLWKINKSTAQSVIGISDYLWETYRQSSFTWRLNVVTPSRQTAWLKLCIGENGLDADQMGIVFMGCGAPNDAFTQNQHLSNLGIEHARMYRHAV